MGAGAPGFKLRVCFHVGEILLEPRLHDIGRHGYSPHRRPIHRVRGQACAASCIMRLARRSMG